MTVQEYDDACPPPNSRVCFLILHALLFDAHLFSLKSTYLSLLDSVKLPKALLPSASRTAIYHGIVRGYESKDSWSLNCIHTVFVDICVIVARVGFYIPTYTRARLERDKITFFPSSLTTKKKFLWCAYGNGLLHKNMPLGKSFISCVGTTNYYKMRRKEMTLQWHTYWPLISLCPMLRSLRSVDQWHSIGLDYNLRHHLGSVFRRW